MRSLPNPGRIRLRAARLTPPRAQMTRQNAASFMHVFRAVPIRPSRMGWPDPAVCLLRRAADRHLVDAQCRLSYADRYALAFLAADTDAGIEGHVVADHAHVLERFRAVADQRRTFDRVGDLAVFDHVGFRRREHELAVR